MLELLEDLGYIYPSLKSTQKARTGKYKCHCGNVFIARINGVLKKQTSSCGCFKKELHTKHGMSTTRLYKIYMHILQRTGNPKDTSFRHYGGRGIFVCDEWRNDFMVFHNWSVDNGYNDYLEIDRINNDGNYEPSNCRWTTRSIQITNTRKVIASNTSGFKGVSFDKSRKKWAAYIQLDNIRNYVGRFENKNDAIMARDEFIIKYNLPHQLSGDLK